MNFIVKSLRFHLVKPAKPQLFLNFNRFMATVPPIAKKVAYKHKYHGKEFDDPYNWIRDDKRQDKDMLNLLEQENAYAQQRLDKVESLTETIYKEFISRLQEDDVDVPVVKDDWSYYKRTEKGKQYPIYCRKKVGTEDEVVLLDMNTMSEDYISLGVYKVSPNHEWLAYALDTSGDEIYKLYFKNLVTGQVLGEPDVLTNVSESVEWSNDNKTIYYTTLDDIHRADKLWRHTLGTKQSEDELLYDEQDKKFWIGLHKSASGQFIFLGTGSSMTSETWVLDANDVSKPLTCFQPRVTNLSYDVEHQGNQFLVLTNDARERINYRLCACPAKIGDTGKDTWKELMPYDPYTELCGMDVFKTFAAIYERNGGVKRIRIMPANSEGNVDGKQPDYHVKFPEQLYTVSGEATSRQNYNSTKVRFVYQSPITPSITYEHDVTSRENKELKKTPVPNYDPSKYTVELIYADVDPSTLPKPSTKPGDHESVFKLTPVPTKLPISVIYRKDLVKKDGTSPGFLYGYGSYGISMDPVFKSTVFSYVDRGFVYATAMIRGGSECGKAWYENGKLLYKKNTFYDFVKAAETLIEQKWTSADRLACEGRSAGGLLIGATLNLRPDLFKVALAGVPFVDVINTMMDDTIPLTINEYEEWSNPNDKEAFDYMLSYSPYDNLTGNRPMPNLFVKAGLNDPRVQYWEPTKYVAKLRDLGYGKDQEVVYKCFMGSGHFGSTGRYKIYKEYAEEFALVIDWIQKSMNKSLVEKL